MEDQPEAVPPGPGQPSSTSHVPVFPRLMPLAPQFQPAQPGTSHDKTTMRKATPRSARDLSTKLQSVLKKKQDQMNVPEVPKSIHERFQPRNWKQFSDKQLKKLTPIERSRYMAYEPEPKEVTDRRRDTQKRVNNTLMNQKEKTKSRTMEEIVETEWDSGLVGYLKAANARLRLRSMRVGYEKHRLEEIKHLIASQPSSIEAVRLKCLLQPTSRLAKPQEFLAKHERERCEMLVEDDTGLTINRTL